MNQLNESILIRFNISRHTHIFIQTHTYTQTIMSHSSSSPAVDEIVEGSLSREAGNALNESSLMVQDNPRLRALVMALDDTSLDFNNAERHEQFMQALHAQLVTLSDSSQYHLFNHILFNILLPRIYGASRIVEEFFAHFVEKQLYKTAFSSLET